MKKIISLVMVGMLSIGIVGCSEKEDYQNLQVQEQNINDNSEIKEDLKFYLEMCEELSNVATYLDETNDKEGAYADFKNVLRQLRNYDNCIETVEVKSDMMNATISAMEMINCMYKLDVCGVEKALSDFETYTQKYVNEYNRLKEEYSISTEEF